MAFETNGRGSSAKKSGAGFPICEKLRPHLARLMGSGGVRSLLSRSLALASAEVRWLRAVHVKADGNLEGLEELETQVTAAEFLEGEIELLAQVLGLLVAFIGEALTLRVLGDVWPDLSLDELDLGNGDENEKAK